MKRKDEILSGVIILVLVGLVVYLYYLYKKEQGNQNNHSIVYPSEKSIARADSLKKALDISSMQIENYEGQLKKLQKDSTNNTKAKFTSILDSLTKYRKLCQKLSTDIVTLNEQFKREMSLKNDTISEQRIKIKNKDLIIAQKSTELQQATENANKQAMRISVFFHDYNTYSNGYNDPDDDLKKSDKAHLIREIEFVYSFSRALTSDDILSLKIEGVAEK